MATAGSIPATEVAMPHDIRRFAEAEADFQRGLGVQVRQASWEFSTTGDPALQEKLRALTLVYREHFSDVERFRQVSAWREGKEAAGDELLVRQVELYWRDYLGAQEDAETRAE